jgi:60 kDa SS-A/Ro ribonucleoprotein
LRNAALVRKARVFPYQLLVAYQSAAKELPKGVTEALQDALEIAIENVPVIPGKVVVCTDVSGSMHAPVTGYRKGATSVVRCIDVAALVAAAMLRRNKRTEIIPFSDDVVPVRLNDRDSVMTNAQRLASLPSGGTNCSSALRYLNRERIAADLVVFVSDNESWIDTSVGRHALAQPTQTMAEWAKLKQRCPAAKMVCIDIQPYAHTQAAEQEDITNVGGFSDQVFSLLADVAKGRTSRGHWVQQIESVSL